MFSSFFFFLSLFRLRCFRREVEAQYRHNHSNTSNNGISPFGIVSLSPVVHEHELKHHENGHREGRQEVFHQRGEHLGDEGRSPRLTHVGEESENPRTTGNEDPREWVVGIFVDEGETVGVTELWWGLYNLISQVDQIKVNIIS